MKRVVLRISGAIVSAVAAFLGLYVLYIPIIQVIAESEWRKTHPPNYLYGVLWFAASGLVAFGFAWLSYASLRYAIGPRSQTDPGRNLR